MPSPVSDALFARAKQLIPGGVNSPGPRVSLRRRRAVLRQVRARRHG